MGPVLFVIFINDLDEGVRNLTLKFADDTKLFSQVSMYEDSEKLQKYLSTQMNGRCCSRLKNANVYIMDTTINSMIILWERNALKQHTREETRGHHHRNTGCIKAMCQGS